MKKVNNNILQNKLTSLALLLFLLGVGFAQFTYYIHTIAYLREVSFILMSLGILAMIIAMIDDMKTELKSSLFSLLLVVLLFVLYTFLRQELHRFDFGVGDASDYYVAGVCSVTYEQDIGFFMPLMASLIGVGYDLLTIDFAPWINVIVYSLSIPISYFIFRGLGLSVILSYILAFLVVLAPSSIWFVKTSFSEVPWQLFLLIFLFLSYQIMEKPRVLLGHILALYLLLFLAPFIRGEGALYFGLVIFLGFYHYWKYNNLKSILLIIVGLFLLSYSIQITVGYKEAYLLGWQFSRVIPNITVNQLLTLLYGVSVSSVVLVGVLYYFRKGYSKLNLTLIITILAVIVKLVIAFIYANKKNMTFQDMYFFNEFGLAVGNFGLPLSILIIIGLVLMHIRASKGDILSFTLVVLYMIFYLPFVMQAVTFEDVHAFFFYWNRYYFSIYMMIHLFALGISINTFYNILKKYISSKYYKSLLLAGVLVVIAFLSFDVRLLKIVSTEAHHAGSYKLYPWLKNKVKNSEFSVVYDKSIIYKQNKAHIGVYHLKTLINREFSTLKIYAKEWEAVSPKEIKEGYMPKNLQYDYVLCLSGDTCNLGNEYLVKESNLTLPIEWREHFGLAEDAKKIHHNDVTKSVVNRFVLHAVLYKRIKKSERDKVSSSKQNTSISSQLLGEGWNFINNRSSAFSPEGKGTIVLPKIKRLKDKVYHLTLRYAVINASKKSVKTVNFSLANGKILKTVTVNTHTTNEIELVLPNAQLPSELGNIELTMEASDAGQIMLRSIIIKKKGE